MSRFRARSVFKPLRAAWAKKGEELQARILAIEDVDLKWAIATIVASLGDADKIANFIGVVMGEIGNGGSISVDRIAMDDDFLDALPPRLRDRHVEALRWILTAIDGWTLPEVVWIVGPVHLRPPPTETTYILFGPVAYRVPGYDLYVVVDGETTYALDGLYGQHRRLCLVAA